MNNLSLNQGKQFRSQRLKEGFQNKNQNNIIQEYSLETEATNKMYQDAISRVSSSNQYLNKNVGFSDGSIAYVNNQGIAKPFTSQEIYNNTKGKNGCPSELVSLNMPWSFVEGDVIPTNPNLIVGSAMVSGQSCGNEGLNVIANKLTNSISSSYIGCYNDTINNTNVVAIPVMNSSNNVNGFVSKVSSTYLNNVAYGS